MRFFRTDAKVSFAQKLIMGSIPFVLLGALYVTGSYYRHLENPTDKVMPRVSEIGHAFWSAAFEPDRTGEYQLWTDTLASGKRYFLAIAITFLAIPIAVNMGCLPWFESTWYPFLIVVRMIPTLSLLSILFILFGLGEASKIMLIVLGAFPTVLMDVFQRTKEIPKEQFYKAKTLGASEFEICYRIVLPQVWPHALNSIKQYLGPAALLLIAAESIAASEGLGYRIFVVRRYMAMDLIIAYVIWITILLAITDNVFHRAVKRAGRWMNE